MLDRWRPHSTAAPTAVLINQIHKIAFPTVLMFVPRRLRVTSRGSLESASQIQDQNFECQHLGRTPFVHMPYCLSMQAGALGDGGQGVEPRWLVGDDVHGDLSEQFLGYSFAVVWR